MIQALRDEAAAASNDVEEDMEEEEAEEDEEVWADGAAGEEDWDDEQQDEEYNEDDFKPADQLGPEDECTFSSDDVKSDSAPPAAPRKGLRRCKSHLGAETLPGDSKESLVLPSPASYVQKLSRAQEDELANILNQIRFLEGKGNTGP